jgi:hypothetical protein
MVRAFVKLVLSDGTFYTALEGTEVVTDGPNYVKPMQLISPILNESGGLAAPGSMKGAEEEVMFRALGADVIEYRNRKWMVIQANNTLEDLNTLGEKSLSQIEMEFQK